MWNYLNLLKHIVILNDNLHSMVGGRSNYFLIWWVNVKLWTIIHYCDCNWLSLKWWVELNESNCERKHSRIEKNDVRLIGSWLPLEGKRLRVKYRRMPWKIKWKTKEWKCMRICGANPRVKHMAGRAWGLRNNSPRNMTLF